MAAGALFRGGRYLDTPELGRQAAKKNRLAGCDCLCQHSRSEGVEGFSGCALPPHVAGTGAGWIGRSGQATTDDDLLNVWNGWVHPSFYGGQSALYRFTHWSDPLFDSPHGL
jgi:hypothetical protein